MRRDALTDPPDNDRLVQCFRAGREPWVARYCAARKEWRGIRLDELEFRLARVTTDPPQEWADIVWL